MTTKSKTQLFKEKLQEQYELWTGSHAQELEAEAHGQMFQVYVNRHVGRHLKSDVYFFASEEVAKACFTYWRLRGGVDILTFAEVKDDYGFLTEPKIYS